MKIFVFLLLVFLGPLPAHAAGLPDAARFSSVIEMGDLGQAREWLDSGLPADFEGKLIGTGLMIGAWTGNLAMMELFVARGADIHKVNAVGEQALLHAAWQGRLEAVRWLVERGARLNRPGREWGALHYAVFAGHAEVVRFLLDKGADVNALSTNGSTPLMMAAREGREAIAETLLAAGALRDIVNEHGDDALRWAMRHNNLSIARAIAGSRNFSTVAAQPARSWGPPVRSQPVPDRVDVIMAQARSMEAEGRRAEAMGLYRAALAVIRQADAARKPAGASTRAASGMVITARRDKPDAQSAALSFATPATSGVQDTPSGAAANASAGNALALPSAAETADDWLRRARALELAGRRKEALDAYRQAAASLRERTPGREIAPAGAQPLP